MHHFGLAFAVVPLDAGKLVWNVSNPVWQKVGGTGKEYGLEGAGDWNSFREYAHFQYTGGISLAEIREGNRPGKSQASVCLRDIKAIRLREIVWDIHSRQEGVVDLKGDYSLSGRKRIPWLYLQLQTATYIKMYC
jgi:hypothetical protein